jgi:acetyl esterase/lipase
MRIRCGCLALVASLASLPATQSRADDVPCTQREDVIYGRKFGMALTMDVFTPDRNANGAGLIVVASGAWVSTHDWVETLRPKVVQAFLNRGYTMFIVVHGSTPKFTIPEILQDLARSVRFIRSRAAEFGIDPDRIGILGFSSGGHLSLMQAMAGDLGDPNAQDPIDRVSSRVQAVACGAPPSDFLNYGKPGENALGRGILRGFRQAFDFHEVDKEENAFMRITDEQKLLEIGRQISPVYHVSADDPPTFIIHGDADTAVPIQQSEQLVAKLREVGVPAELWVRKGAGHFWRDPENDWPKQADWFDKYLLKK